MKPHSSRAQYVVLAIQLHVELLLGLPGRKQLMGVIALGSKRSEEPYTPSDLRLLQTVATQTGLALEVSLAGACRPAQGVSGDYYDVIELPDNRLGFAIGDVSAREFPPPY